MVYAPNTFSPNDDKINEVFYAYATNISNFKMQVFDRWGQLLFTTEQLENGWDGTFLGKKVTDDIYAWKASFTDYKSKQHVVTGHIEVLR